MNGRYWRVIFVEPDNPFLIDRTGSSRIATTDPNTNCVYISTDLNGRSLETVLVHELGHCVMVSYGLISDIRRMVRPEYWVEIEEWICNFISDYGYEVFQVATDILETDAFMVVPRTFNMSA